MKKNILITGGAGYIGSHVCKCISQNGFTPIVYDNLSKGHDWAVKWGPLEVGDIHDKDRLTAVIKRYKPLAVMHFAASIEVSESMQMPEDYYYNNVAGSLSLVTAMHECNVPYIVFSSTAATYGTPQTKKITEDHPQEPINPYGQSKLMVEKIIQDMEMAHGIRHVFLRYFNAAGADSNGEIGEAHNPESHLIPIVMQAANGDRKQLMIFGDDYNTPDGTCLRDYIHVEDLATAHLLALEHLLADNPSNYFNLGTGTGYSVRELHKVSEQIVGHAIPVDIAARRQGDPGILIADSRKAEEVLGWKRKKVLRDILESAWTWYQQKQ